MVTVSSVAGGERRRRARPRSRSPSGAAPGAPGPRPGRAGRVASDTGQPPGQAVGRERAAALADVGQVLVPEHAQARPPPPAASTARARRWSSGPGGQVTPGEMLSQTSMSRSRSASRPCPLSMRSRIFSSQPLPSRQGVHWPHDSRWKKRTMRQAARTMQVVWSMGDDRPGPGHGADRGDGLVGQQHVEVLRAQPRRGRPAGDERLELVVVADPAAQPGVVDQIPEAEPWPIPARSCRAA